MSKRFESKQGFTLAEVLITLGIIGVVAAMTIPTLIANTNSSKFASQFKKSLSTLNQAALMAVAHHDIDYGSIVEESGCKSTSGGGEKLADGKGSICALFNSTLSGATYLDAAAIGKLTSNGKAYTVARAKTLPGASGDKITSFTGLVGYQLADGSMVVVPNNLHECTIDGTMSSSDMSDETKLKNCIGFIDVNGATLPNKEVICNSADDTALSTDVCTVPKDTSHMTDIFPVVFHDQTVEPATNAAKAILTGATAKTVTNGS